MTLSVGPSDKGQYEWGGRVSFLVVGRRQIKLPSAPPMPKGLKKKNNKKQKNYVTQQVEHDM